MGWVGRTKGVLSIAIQASQRCTVITMKYISEWGFMTLGHVWIIRPIFWLSAFLCEIKVEVDVFGSPRPSNLMSGDQNVL